MLGYRGGEVRIMSVVSPRESVSVSSIGYFSSIGSSSRPSHSSFNLSLGSRYIQEYFKKKKGRKQKFINPQQEKARHEERRKQMRVTFQAKLVVGFGELIPLESGYDKPEEQGTGTVTKDNEVQA